MVVKLPGIPKRPGPLMLYSSVSHDAGWGKWWAMVQTARAAEAQGLKVLYLSFEPRRYSKA